MKDTTHVCPICGQKYEYCDYCKRMLSIGITPWRAICDTEACYNIYMDIREIKTGRADNNVLENLKTNMWELEQKDVEMRENIKDYIKTLALLEQPNEKSEVNVIEIKAAPNNNTLNYNRKNKK